jgi:hypothetical protein
MIIGTETSVIDNNVDNVICNKGTKQFLPTMFGPTLEGHQCQREYDWGGGGPRLHVWEVLFSHNQPGE